MRTLGDEPPRLEDLDAFGRTNVIREPAVYRSSRGVFRVSPSVPFPRPQGSEVKEWFSPRFSARLTHKTGSDFSPTLTWRESQGGRKYPTYLPSYSGDRVVSEKKWRSVRRPGGLLLSAISRVDRKDFRAPLGTLFLDVDIDQCFPAILASLSKDGELRAACRGDLHRVSGDLLVPTLEAGVRRSIGKLFNLSAVGGVTAIGWRIHLREAGIDVSLSEAERMLATWWESFGAARTFRREWADLHHSTLSAGKALRIYLPGGHSYLFEAGALRGDVKGGYLVKTGTPEQRVSAAVRTTFSSIFRGIESVILDRALQLLYPLRGEGLRLVLPLYDGLLLQVPEETAPDLAEAAKKAFEQALTEVGVAASVSTKLKPSWA